MTKCNTDTVIKTLDLMSVTQIMEWTLKNMILNGIEG
jgi:hypothetical protein